MREAEELKKKDKPGESLSVKLANIKTKEILTED